MMLYFSPYKINTITATNIQTLQSATSKYSTVLECYSVSTGIHHHHHHHHLALQPIVSFRLLSQVSPSSSILSCLLPVFNFQLFQIFHDIFLPSLSCSSCWSGFQSNNFLAGLVWSILWICPSHLILCTLMNLTISAPSINLLISMLFRILHTLSILTGPNIFLHICLSKMRWLFSSSAVKFQACDQYVMTGLIIILYIFILVFFFY